MFSICKKLMSTGNITCFIFLYLKYCKGFSNKNTTLPTYDALCMFISLLINLCSFNLVCFSFEMRGKNIFNNFLCILISYSRELKPKKSRRLRFFLQIYLLCSPQGKKAQHLLIHIQAFNVSNLQWIHGMHELFCTTKIREREL